MASFKSLFTVTIYCELGDITFCYLGAGLLFLEFNQAEVRIELHICILSGNSRSMPIPLAHKLLDLEPFDHEFRRISKRVCRQGDKFTLASISYKIHGSNLYANDSEIFFRKTILVTDFIDLK